MDNPNNKSVPEEGWFGQPKYSTPTKKSFYVVSTSASIFFIKIIAYQILHQDPVLLFYYVWSLFTYFDYQRSYTPVSFLCCSICTVRWPIGTKRNHKTINTNTKMKPLSENKKQNHKSLNTNTRCKT